MWGNEEMFVDRKDMQDANNCWWVGRLSQLTIANIINVIHVLTLKEDSQDEKTHLVREIISHNARSR